MSLRTAVRRAAAGGCGCNGRVAVAAARAPVLAARYSSAAVARTAVVPRFAAFRSFTTTSPTFKEARVAWAQDPFITYEELKPLTERPTDVSKQR
jgi:hypothetical protein